MRLQSSTIRAAMAAPGLLSLILLTACTFDGSAPGSAGGGDDTPGATGDGGSDIGGRGDGGVLVDGGGGGGGRDGGGGGGGVDAGPPRDGAPPTDANQGDACGDKCLDPGVCDQATGTCVFDCSAQGGGGDGGDQGGDMGGGGDPCPDTVVCPAGIPCRVECTDRRSCEAGIDCSAASSCDLVCTGRESCRGTLECGTGSCDIQCGQDSCTQAIHCQNACVCNVDCHPSACGMQADCPAGCDQLNDCDVTDECNTCGPP